MDRATDSTLAAGSGLKRPPWTHNPLGGWQSLPGDLAALLLETVHSSLLDDLQPAQYLSTRFINKTFAARLKHRLPIFLKYTAHDYAWLFVEHVMLMGNEIVRGVRPQTSANDSFLRTQAYKACTCPHQFTVQFYEALTHVVDSLLWGGTLRGLSKQQRETFAKFMANTFSYIERYNCDRCNKLPVKQLLLNAFKAHPYA